MKLAAILKKIFVLFENALTDKFKLITRSILILYDEFLCYV